MNETRTMLAALAAAALVLGAGPAEAAKTTLVVGMASADAGKLDPHLTATTPDKGLLNWMFNGLVRIEPGRASPEFIEPDLAESWESTPDGLVWTFNIRRGVQCHHGYGEFTAEDAVYSINRASRKETSSFTGDFSSFDNAEALDSHTLKVTLKNPIPSLLGVLANYHGGNMVCKKAAEEAGENFMRRPIGTGPFMFADYQPQQFVKLVANKQYFRGTPKLEEIIYRYIPSDASRDLAFQSGEVDLTFGKQDQSWVDRIKRIPGAVVVSMEPAELSNIHLNITVPPLDDPRVRQAVAHSVDRSAMVAFRGAAVTRPAVSIVPAGYLGTDEEAPLYGYDPDRARALLAEAGHAGGVTIKTIHTTLPGMMSTIEAIQAQLKKTGINLQIEPVEHATFHAQIRQDLSPVVHYSAARFPVADVYLTQFFDSASTVNTKTAVTNFSHCDVADEEIQAARVEPDLEKQKALWKAAQRKIVEAVCAVPIYENMQLWAWKDNLDLGYELEGSLNLSPPITELTHFKD